MEKAPHPTGDTSPLTAAGPAAGATHSTQFTGNMASGVTADDFLVERFVSYKTHMKRLFSRRLIVAVGAMLLVRFEK